MSERKPAGKKGKSRPRGGKFTGNKKRVRGRFRQKASGDVIQKAVTDVERPGVDYPDFLFHPVQFRLDNKGHLVATTSTRRGAAEQTKGEIDALPGDMIYIIGEDRLRQEVETALAHIDEVQARLQVRQAEIEELGKETRSLIKEMQAA